MCVVKNTWRVFAHAATSCHPGSMVALSCCGDHVASAAGEFYPIDLLKPPFNASKPLEVRLD